MRGSLQRPNHLLENHRDFSTLCVGHVHTAISVNLCVNPAFRARITQTHDQRAAIVHILHVHMCHEGEIGIFKKY